METSILWLSVQRSLNFCIISGCGFLISSRMLLEEASVMIAEKGTEGFSRMSLREILFVYFVVWFFVYLLEQ